MGICNHIQSYHASIILNDTFTKDNYISLIESNSDYIIIDFSDYMHSENRDIYEFREFLSKYHLNAKPNKIILIADYFNDEYIQIPSISNKLKKIFTDLTFIYPGIRIIPIPNTVSNDISMIETIIKEIDVIMSQDFSYILSDFDTEVSISDHTLSATINLGPSLSIFDKSCFKYRFFIIKDSEVIYKTNPSNSNTISFTLRDSGSYVVQSYVHCDKYHVFIRTDAYFYATESLLKAYSDYLSIPASNETIFKIHKTKEPFYDFLITRNIDTSCIKPILDEYEISSSVKKMNCDIFSNNIKTYNNNTLIFSGITKIHGNIYTEQAYVSFKDLFNLTEKTGTYTIARFDDETGLISKDLMGYGHIWYYSNNNTFAISNRYSLLIKILKTSGITLKLDYEQIKIICSSMSNYFLLNRLSNRMDIEQIQLLPIDEDILISTNEGINLIPNETHSILSDSTILNYDSYNDLLDTAINEITDNLSAAIRYDCSNKILQLTGGMDSRTVLSVLTSSTIPNNILLSTRGKKEDGDVTISAQLSELIGMNYDSSSDIRYTRSFTDTLDIHREHNMGLIYSHNANPYISSKYNLILSGGTGDAICRSQYSRHFVKGFAEYSDNIHDLSIAWRSWLSMSKLYGDRDSDSDSISLLCESMNAIPVKSSLEKIDRMYMFFRSNYHFEPYLDYIANSLIWMPLSCPAMLRLNHLTHDAFRGIKLETDIIEKANPILSKIPFEKSQDNIDCKINHDIYNNLPSWIDNIQVASNNGMSKWMSQRRKTTTSNALDPSFNLDEIYFKLSYNKLKYIAQNINQLSSICLPLYYFMMNNHHNKNIMTILCNKLSSIIDQYILSN